MNERTRHIVRRIPLLVVLLLLAWLFLGERPRAIELVYDLPEPAPRRVEVTLRDEEGRVAAQIVWSGGTGPAADRQVHTPRLAPGDYALEAILETPDGTRRRIERTLSVGRDDERIVIHLR